MHVCGVRAKRIPGCYGCAPELHIRMHVVDSKTWADGEVACDSKNATYWRTVPAHDVLTMTPGRPAQGLGVSRTTPPRHPIAYKPPGRKPTGGGNNVRHKVIT
jgi:hypothetical protein